MNSYETLFALAADKHGGPSTLEGKLERPVSSTELLAISDSCWLSAMAKNLFRAGFSWRVIESKWLAFEEAFDRFDVNKVSHYNDDDVDRLLGDNSIVRNGAKIEAVIRNAAFAREIAAEHLSIGAYIALWPARQHNELLHEIATRGTRLGGTTGQRFLRQMGKDTYILTPDVIARLCAEGVITGAPNSRRAMKSVQDAFNTWMDQSGRGLTEISQVLAMSI